MKEKNMKRFLLVFALLAVLGLAVGCGSKDKPNEQEVLTPAQPAEEPETVETEEETDTPALNGDWTNMQFTLAGQSYQLPCSYKELEEAGWSFDLADYGYPNGYVMNPGDKVHGTIDLENPAYDEELTLTVGFVNNSDEVRDIRECDIWSLKLDTCRGFRQVESYPEMTVGNGLTLGSSRSDVEAACGPCEDIYESAENGYAVYNYDYDYTYYLKITVYDDKGITSFDLSTYE